jgi:hypothetical protein
VKNNEMGGTCGALVRDEICIRGFGEVTEDKRSFGSPRSRWEDNIKIDFQDIACNVMNWTDLSQDKNKWCPVVNAVMNFQVAKNKRATISVLRRTLLRDFVC